MRTTSIAYDDVLRKITTQTDLNSNGDGALSQITLVDQLGRVRKTQDPAGNVTETRHETPQGGGSNFDLHKRQPHSL